MAKTRKNHTGAGAIAALLGAIDIVAASEKAKVNGDLTEEQQADAVNTAMDAVTQATAVIGDSNVVTALELQDDAIEAMHDADDAAEQAEQAEQADDADGDAE
jgi:hypothetical protein